MKSNQKSYKSYLNELPTIERIVRERARLLIEHDIWGSITFESLDRWLSNFQGEEEQLLSILMLDQLVIRSSDQTAGLLAHAIETVLPNVNSNSVWEALEESDYVEMLTSKTGENKGIKIIPVIRDSDSPAKSGPAVARLYRRYVNINDSFMIWPWNLDKQYNKGVRIFVFIDDTVGSGKQFCKFFTKTVDKTYPDARFIYIPLLAHQDGLEYIRNLHPEIRVGAVEVTDEASNFFNRKATKNISDLKKLYLKVAKKYLSKRIYNKMPLGYEGLSMTISFSHSTPNTTLPLYWYESDDFSPIVRR